MTSTPRMVGRHTSAVSPGLPIASRRSGIGNRLMRWIQDCTRVEYSGFYSLEKLLAFQNDKRPTYWITIGNLWLAAMPTCLLKIGLELVPLQDPSLGWRRNGASYVRQFIRVWVGSMLASIHIQEFMPQIKRPLHHIVCIGLLHTPPFLGTLLALAQIFDVFPIPFSSLVPLLPTMVVGLVLRNVFVQGMLERDPVLKIQFRRYERLAGFAFSLIIVYCVYGFVFRQVGSHVQLVLSFVLFGIKQWAKNLMWRLSHVQDHHDLSAESVSCGVHLFHAMFAIMCLQSAHSYGTFMIVLGMGMIQDLLALRYMRQISGGVCTTLKELERDGLVDEANSPYHAHWTANQIREVQSMPAETRAKVFEGIPVMVVRGAYYRHEQTATSPRNEVSSPVISLLPSTSPAAQSEDVRKARATQAVAHLLHCREVVLLRMFVDIFVPLSYLAYCTAMLLLPNNNRHYSGSLRDVNWVSLGTLCVKVWILVAIKITALVLSCRLFNAHGQPSGLHQLVFVICSQRYTMQSWLLMNFIQLADFSLAHLGNDLSFQFAWLHRKP